MDWLYNVTCAVITIMAVRLSPDYLTCHIFTMPKLGTTGANGQHNVEYLNMS